MLKWLDRSFIANAIKEALELGLKVMRVVRESCA
jgi:hypothetical protein